MLHDIETKYEERADSPEFVRLYKGSRREHMFAVLHEELNQHFDDNKLYHFQANLWHKIKTMPVSVLKNYIEVQDLPQTVGLGHEIWDFMRQSDYMKQQVHDGVYAWYIRNQQHTFDQLLRDLNIDASLIEHELSHLLNPIIQQLISQDYLRGRARLYLEKFYYSENTLKILNIQ